VGSASNHEKYPLRPFTRLAALAVPPHSVKTGVNALMKEEKKQRSAARGLIL
jgi:hypothetical protein